MASHSSIPGESHGQRSLAGYSPRDHKQLDTTEQLTHKHTHTGGIQFPDQESKLNPLGR